LENDSGNKRAEKNKDAPFKHRRAAAPRTSAASTESNRNFKPEAEGRPPALVRSKLTEVFCEQAFDEADARLYLRSLNVVPVRMQTVVAKL
jgi:hypothetical protein